MTPLISILIITYNRPDDLLALLRSINQQGEHELLKEILILNNSSTSSYKEVEEFIGTQQQLPIQYQYSTENLGVSRGRNRLMQEATGELFLVLDDDVEFQGTGNFSKIARLFDEPIFKDSNCGIITFRVLYYDNKEVQRTAFPHKQFEAYQHKASFLTYYFAGCAHLIKREVLAATGFYPTDFFYGMEEYDLSYRAINSSYALGYSSSITFEHKESPLGRQANHLKLASQWKNKSTVSWKYLPMKYFLSTALAWSWEYIRNARGHWKTWFTTGFSVFAIPFRTKRQPINKKALAYLKQVEARLKY